MDTHGEVDGSARRFSCFIIGESSLTAGCAGLVHAAGHRIEGIASVHAAVAAWATEHGVPLIDPADLEAALSRQPFDHLFSIVNFRMIPAPVLRLPRRLAINFHDGPLPRYAGMNVTSWAIMRGERQHGVTWHIMTEEVDAGPILRQQAVTIASDDTALTLNAKCYDAALESFAALLKDLASGDVFGREQDRAQRTYFPLTLRPPAAAVIDWECPVAEISALVRALDFGPYPNPLDLPKLAHGPAFWVCPQVERVDAPVAAAPGTLVAAGPEGLVIAAADGQLRIRRLLRLDGSEVTPQGMLQESGLRTGEVLQRPERLLERATALTNHIVRHRSFWASRLRGLRAVSLPFAVAGGEARQARVPFELPAEFVRRASAWHGGRHAAEQAVAVFAAYLARISGEDQQDIWLAHTELQGMDGLEHLFAAEVPMRIEVRDDDSFESLGARLLAELDRAQRHVTHDRTLRVREAALLTEPEVGVALVDSLTSCAPPSGPVRLVLELGGGRGELRYDTARLEPDTASRMVRHFVTLLGAVAAEPGGALRRLPMIPPDELDRLLVEPNCTATTLPKQATIHQLIEAQAARVPDSIAVVSADLTLTYRELDERAERLAGRLRCEGVGPETLVAVLVRRSIDMVVAPLAVLKAGGAYLPLDPTHPPDRIAFVLADSGARILVAEPEAARSLEGEAPGAVASLTVITTEDRAGTTPSAPARPGSSDGASLAYVLYTSGSTGRPKGVEITHGAVVNLLASMAGEPGLAANDILLAVTTLTFDIAGLEIWLPLTVGARVVIAPWEATFDGSRLAGALERSGATVMQATPVTWKLLIDAGWQGRPGFRALCGGEALSAALANELLDRCGEVWNLYGPTETTIWSTAARVERGAMITLGKPIANTRVYLLDPAGQPVPLDVPGEIYIAGAGVARGYLGRPELTAERFGADPLSPVPGVRRYRTGDLARRRDDGTLEYLGRVDFQIKLRGFRIELGEIEAVLARHAAVQAAVAVAHGEAADRRIVAYYVLRAGMAATQAELRAHLREHLPDYMIPSIVIPVQELALTHSGKIDRKALPAPDAASLPRRTDLVAPCTQLERLLVATWEEILGVPVGVTDDFFELSGNSLAAVRMLQRVESDMGQRVAIGEFFRNPTVRQLAATVVGTATIAETPIAQLQAGAPGVAPVHFLHGDFTFGGIYARNLARYLSPDQPVYLLEPPDVGGPDSIEEAAQHAVALIRTVQPAGPYLLLGVCNGGIIAFEAAQRLAAAGEKVLDVVVVNASGTNSMLAPVDLFVRVKARARGMTEEERLALFLDLRERVLRHVASAKRRGQSAIPAIGAQMLMRGMRTLRLLASGAQPRPRSIIDPMDDESSAHGRGRYISRMMQAYVPRRYAGHMTLVLSDQDAEEHFPDQTAGWGRVAPRIDVFTVPGDHHDSLVGHASSLGSAITAILRAAQPTRTSAIDGAPGRTSA